MSVGMTVGTSLTHWMWTVGINLPLAKHFTQLFLPLPLSTLCVTVFKQQQEPPGYLAENLEFV